MASVDHSPHRMLKRAPSTSRMRVKNASSLVLEEESLACWTPESDATIVAISVKAGRQVSDG